MVKLCKVFIQTRRGVIVCCAVMDIKRKALPKTYKRPRRFVIGEKTYSRPRFWTTWIPLTDQMRRRVGL